MTPTSLSRIGGIELACQRYHAMISWYRDLLGATVIYRDDVHAWLRLPNNGHLGFLASGAQTKPRECTGVIGPAFEFASFTALQQCYCELKQRNIYPERAVKNGFVTSLIYRDPDQNLVGLRYYPESELPHTDLINPLGAEFDPDTLLEVA